MIKCLGFVKINVISVIGSKRISFFNNLYEVILIFDQKQNNLMSKLGHTGLTEVLNREST